VRLDELKGEKMRDLITGKLIDVASATVTLESAQYVILK